MRPTTGSIQALSDTARARLDRLSVLAMALGGPIGPADRRLISYSVVEAANLWAGFSRCLFLSCALGARDASGNRIVSNRVPSVDAALTLAVHAVKPHLRRTNEQWTYNNLPDFQNKGQLAKTLLFIQASVYPSVDLALSYQSRVLSDLPTMRNFFAHKAERAARSARGIAPRYGLSRNLAPEDLLCAVPPAGSDILLREWLADLEAILSLMP